MQNRISLALLSLSTLAVGQLTQGSNGQFICAIPDGAYCAGSSLSSNIIVRCSNGTGFPGNCNDNLAGVPPLGVKTSALCYQSSGTSGDAACSFNGLVYGNNGTFPIPGTSASASVSSTPSSTPSSAPPSSRSSSGSGATSSASSTPSGSASASGTPTTVITTTTTPSGSVGPVTLTTTAGGKGTGSSGSSQTTGAATLAGGADKVARDMGGLLAGLLGFAVWAL